MLFYAGTDSWVYILFGALWLAFAIYKGSKKADRAETTGKEASSNASSGLENIMDSFLAEEESADVFPEIRKEKVMEKPVVEPEKQVVFKESIPSVPHEKTAEPTTKPKVRKINMKKAVIYSEILRRPYE